MFKLFKDILHIFQVPSKILLSEWNENKYSATYLASRAEKARKQEVKELFNDCVYELYSAISEASDNGNYEFETEYNDYIVGRLQRYYQKSNSEEWSLFVSKLEKDFIDVSIEYHNRYPWLITFDWSGKDE